MVVNIIKRDSWRIPRLFLSKWIQQLNTELVAEAHESLSDQELVLVFVSQKEMTTLNREFRKKNRVTDVLSFQGFEPGHFGELVFCGAVIDSQAEDHGLEVNEELGYLVLHGVLHLLGYEHEKGGPQAKKMFALQDRIFARMRESFF